VAGGVSVGGPRLRQRLFAASEVATGKVTDAWYPRHRHEEFLKFLQQVAKTYPRRKLQSYATTVGLLLNDSGVLEDSS
jgi:hypothetical protein